MQWAKIKSFTRVLIVIASVLLLTVCGLRWYLRSVDLGNPEPIAMVLKTGETLGHIARRLHRHHGLRWPKRLLLLAYLEQSTRRIQAGEYQFEAHVHLGDILDKFVSGQVVLYNFTIVEGWTVRQLLTALAKQDKVQHRLHANTQTLMAALGQAPQLAEGLFFPDTYRYAAGSTDISILQQAYTRMQQELAYQWQLRDHDVPYDTAYQALIAASLIEKETANQHERPIIAGIIVRRLNLGMRLQIDAAVIYGLGPQFDSSLSRADLRSKTRYNTYLYQGLVPSPIAIASLSAISAALHPADTKALYYVAKGDGSHEFSATLAAHRRAIKRYLLDQ